MNTVAEYFFRYFNYLFALVIAAMYANALLYPNMGVDASFYLRVTECIMEGAIPEHDLRILYPPLIFYMLLPVKLIVGKTIAYELFLGYMFLVQLINAFMIYKISSKYTENKFIWFFAALLYLFLSIKLEGEYFFLEPFVNLWGLLAVWIYLKRGNSGIFWLICTGFLTFLAFLIKQYGLAYAGLIGILILVDERPSLKAVLLKELAVFVGFAGGLLIFIALFRLGYGVYYDFFAGGRLNLYGEKDIQAFLTGLIKYFLIAPFLLIIFVPGVFRKLFGTRNHFVGYLFLLILFSFQLYLQQYAHYYMLMLPAFIILGVLVFGLGQIQNKWMFFLVILLSLSVNELFIGSKTKSHILSTQSTLKEEIRLAENINVVVPSESEVYLFSDVKLYYLCHFKPVIPEKYGYAYNNALSKKDLSDILSEADKLLVYDHQLNQNYHLLDGILVIETDSLLKDFDNIDKVGKHLIYQRKPLNDINY